MELTDHREEKEGKCDQELTLGVQISLPRGDWITLRIKRRKETRGRMTKGGGGKKGLYIQEITRSSFRFEAVK